MLALWGTCELLHRVTLYHLIQWQYVKGIAMNNAPLEYRASPPQLKKRKRCYSDLFNSSPMFQSTNKQEQTSD